MKNYLITLTLLCFFLSGCKKERTCTCDITTSGTVTSHAKSNGLTFSLNLGIGVPIPPITVVAAKDTNFVTPYSYSSTYSESYDKISKRNMKQACPSSTEESINEPITNITPGSYTVTSTNVGTKSGKCSIK